MPRASRKKLNKNIDQDLWDYFAYLISNLRNHQEIEEFLYDFLTPEERMMLSKRLMLHLMLENGYKIWEIESVLSVSKETIRIHRNVWGRGGSNYKKIIRKIANKEKAEKFWKKIETKLKPLDLFLRSKTDMRARAKFASGDW